MKINNMTHLILFTLSSLSGLSITSSVYAASESYCNQYVVLAVQQYRSAVQGQCGLTGLRWNNNAAGQKNWCLSVNKAIAEQETQARQNALIACPTSFEGRGFLINALVHAAVDDNVAEIKRLIAKGADINAEPGGNDGTALRAAISAQAVNAVKFFINAGVNPNRTSNGWINPLSDLLHNEQVNYDLLVYLLQHGSKPNWQGEAIGDHGLPLHAAIEKGDIKAVQILLEHQADPNLSYDYIPPLTRAIKAKQHEIANILRTWGAKEKI